MQSVAYNNKTYKVDTKNRMIWVVLPRKKGVREFPIEREIDFIGPTAFAVRKLLPKT